MLCHVTITNLTVLYNQKTCTPVLSRVCAGILKPKDSICKMGKRVIFRVCIYLCSNTVLAGIVVCLSSREGYKPLSFHTFSIGEVDHGRYLLMPEE